jgi:hypothetical protein
MVKGVARHLCIARDHGSGRATSENHALQRATPRSAQGPDRHLLSSMRVAKKRFQTRQEAAPRGRFLCVWTSESEPVLGRAASEPTLLAISDSANI